MSSRRSQADSQISLTHTYRQSIETVFTYWTDADLMKLWWAPPGYSVTEIIVDAREGGDWRIKMVPHGDGPELTLVGEFKIVEFAKRLEMTWAWQREDGNSPGSTVLVQFNDTGDGTEVHVQHSGIAPASAISQHLDGWECSLYQLSEVLKNA